MTDQLQHLFREEAGRIDVPPPPTDAILADGRARRRTHRTRNAFAIAASVAVVAGTLVGVAGLVDGDGQTQTPGPAGTPSARPSPTTAPTTYDEAPSGPITVSGAGVGDLTFGSDADRVMASMTDRFGEPDLTTGPQEYSRIPGEDGWFEVADDPISPSWRHPVASVSCWAELCLIFGGRDEGSLQLRGWELAEYRRWPGPELPQDRDPLDVRLDGTGVALGDSWETVHAAYPETVVAGGEGASVTVRNTPWPGISDGVGAWRLSGVWDYTKPDEAPEGAVVTRLSGGEGPEPGCC